MQRICPIPPWSKVGPRFSARRVAPVPFHAVVAGVGLVSMVEIQFAGGTRYYSYEGISAPGGWWKDAVISIGEFSRETPVLPGEARVSDATIIMDNTDLEFSTLKATESFRNTKLIIKHGDVTHGAAGLTTVFTGEIANYNLSQAQCVFSVRDLTYDRFREQLTGEFNTTDFPNLPLVHLGKLIPIIYGRNTDVDSPALRGMVPGYLVDQAQGQAKYIYVLARHPCHAVLEVFNYGRALGPGAYTATVRAYGPYNCQCLEFNTDQEEAAVSSEISVSANVEGIAQAGVLIENPVSQFRHALTNYMGLLEEEIHDQSWEQCRVSLQTYKGAMVIEGDDVLKDDVVARFQTSSNLFMQPTRFGTFGLYALKLDHEISLAEIQTFTDEDDILRGSFSVTGYPDPVSRLVYEYAWYWSLKYFLRRPHHIDSAEELQLRRDVRETINLWYLRDDATATAVATRRHDYSKQAVQLIRFELPVRFFGLELNDHFLLTHWEGVSASGNGYQGTRCRITGLRHQLEPGSMKLTIDAVVVPAQPARLGLELFQYHNLWRTRADGSISGERLIETINAG